MLLYLWDGGLDVCVELIGSSPFMRMGNFVPGRAVIDDAQRGKYMALSMQLLDIGMADFVPSPATIDVAQQEDAVTLLKWIRKFSMAQDIRPCVAVHIFSRIGFAVAKVGELRENPRTTTLCRGLPLNQNKWIHIDLDYWLHATCLFSTERIDGPNQKMKDIGDQLQELSDKGFIRPSSSTWVSSSSIRQEERLDRLRWA
ncbi:hypothetical protein Tco_0963090 [Tanacetum coccineum]